MLSYEIDGGIVYITVTGKVEFREDMDFCQDLYARPELPNPLKILRDIREQDGTFADADGLKRQMIDLVKSSIPAARFAIVASDDLHYGISRIFQARLDEEIDIRVFRDFDEAKVWLL